MNVTKQNKQTHIVHTAQVEVTPSTDENFEFLCEKVAPWLYEWMSADVIDVDDYEDFIEVFIEFSHADEMNSHEAYKYAEKMVEEAIRECAKKEKENQNVKQNNSI